MFVTTESQQIEQKMSEVQKNPRFHEFIHYLPKNKWIVKLKLRNLSELDPLKEQVRQAMSAMDIKTEVWTDLKNIPENLSLGLFNEMKTMDETLDAVTTESTYKPQKIDEIDMQITKKLSENGRASFRKIAQEIGIATDTVSRRYRRLKRNGALTVTIQVNLSKLGYHAMFDIRIAYSSRTNSFEMLKNLVSTPDLVSLMKTNGDYDIHAIAFVRDLKHLLSIQDKMLGNPGITKFELTINDKFINRYPIPCQFMSTF
jgi:DNA-binding Lrp family transcriptional regulator